MPPHSDTVGWFLRFKNLDRCAHLKAVVCLGFRFRDDTTETWTAFVNRVKAGDPQAVGAAEEALRRSCATLRYKLKDLLVVPIIGSAHATAAAAHTVTRLATAVAQAKNWRLSTDLIAKDPHRSLHGLRSADERDAEVDGKYRAVVFESLGLEDCRGVLLVDDLVTRGTTMNDAARAIREINPEVSVFGMALAKTEKLDYWRERRNECLTNDHLHPELVRLAGRR